MTNTTAEQADSSTSTTALWDSVQKTDPKHTKAFERTGGFSGTAINPTYQIRRATEQFGPIGIGWGYDVVEEKYVEGAPIGVLESGEVASRTIVHTVRLELWYILGGKRGAVQRSGATTFVGRNRHGTFTDEEAPKKSETDALMKCLTMLGFSADVHMGLYDDCKYVDELRVQFSPDGFTDESDQPQGRSESEGDSKAANRAERYRMYREKLKKGVTDVALARKAITADKELNDLDRSMLLSLPELRVEGAPAHVDSPII